MTLEILTPESPRWSLFVRLPGNTLTDGMPADTWRCGNDGRGGSKHRYTEAVLAELGGIDIEGTLEFFCQYGGHCDCEVLLNVDPETEEQNARHH